MKRHVGYKPEEILVVTAEGTECPDCGGSLWIVQHRDRWVQRLDNYYHLVRNDRQCVNPACPGERPLYRPHEDLRFALPRKTFGFDVTMAVGERHLAGEPLAAIGRDLNANGVPIDQTHVGRLFRDYQALWQSTRDPAKLVERLRAQGGAVLMADGVQFDGQSPVLYVAWDAVSGIPLLGERREFRGQEDLKFLLERVKAVGFPVRAVVTDKETGLVPAVKEVFPGTPYQYCQTHFLSNCAKPLKPDRTELGSSVKDRAEQVRLVAKRIHQQELKEKKLDDKEREPADPSSACSPSSAPLEGSLSEEPDLTTPRGFAKEVCALVRQNARRTGKAPLDPPELERHVRLSELHAVVEERRSAEKGGPVPSEGWAPVRRWVGGVPLAGRPC
jgi:ribosomal protein S27AE